MNLSRLPLPREALMGGLLSEGFWLPLNTSRDALPPDEAARLPQPAHFLLSLPLACLLAVARGLFEICIARPVGRKLGIADSAHPQSLLSILRHRLPVVLGKLLPSEPPIPKVDANGNSIHLTQNGNGLVASRRRGGPPKSQLDKFAECSYRFSFYSLIFLYGATSLWDKSWTWETLECWRGYPAQAVDSRIWWYYILQGAFYWALLFSLFADVRRTDWAMNGVHHVVTLGLLWLSWVGNFIRIGSLVLLVHDAVDPWLEGAKMARYAGAHQLGNSCFAAFTLIWFASRLVIYPLWILRSTMWEVPAVLGPFPAYYLFNGLLLSLQVLHLLWTTMIIKALYKAWKEGTQTEDCRSEDEWSESEDDKED